MVEQNPEQSSKPEQDEDSAKNERRKRFVGKARQDNRDVVQTAIDADRFAWEARKQNMTI